MLLISVNYYITEKLIPFCLLLLLLLLVENFEFKNFQLITQLNSLQKIDPYLILLENFTVSFSVFFLLKINSYTFALYSESTLKKSSTCARTKKVLVMAEFKSSKQWLQVKVLVIRRGKSPNPFAFSCKSGARQRGAESRSLRFKQFSEEEEEMKRASEAEPIRPNLACSYPDTGTSILLKKARQLLRGDNRESSASSSCSFNSPLCGKTDWFHFFVSHEIFVRKFSGEGMLLNCLFRHCQWQLL